VIVHEELLRYPPSHLVIVHGVALPARHRNLQLPHVTATLSQDFQELDSLGDTGRTWGLYDL
jgi:hypothetical protein